MPTEIYEEKAIFLQLCFEKFYGMLMYIGVVTLIYIG